MFTGTYTLSFSTTSVGPTSLSTVYANNIGSNNKLFFSGSVTDAISFTGAPFLFDPSEGNLVLDLIVKRGNTAPQSSFAAGCSGDTNRGYNFFGSSTSHGIGGNLGECTPNSYGRKTQFTVSPATVPEPSSFAPLASGLLGLFAMDIACRRRIRRA